MGSYSRVMNSSTFMQYACDPTVNWPPLVYQFLDTGPLRIRRLPAQAKQECVADLVIPLAFVL